VENTLFEPFVSTKAAGKGRGLGLFIVKQLLDSEDCFIELLSDRNARKRLYKFRIDLKGVINE
jgi:C4-dicarboxylate-specific signal transduction histidine kinase